MAKKRTVIPITSAGDLIDLVNHNSDVLERRIKKLARSNRKLKLLCVFAVGYTIYTAMECRRQEERIYQLSVKMQKLERDEEE